MKNTPTMRSGFTMVEIMIVVAIIGLLAVMALPSYVRARASSQVSSCLNNLRQIEGAKDVLAIESKKSTGDTITEAEVNPYLKRSMTEIEEPAGGSYALEAIGTPPVCSIGGLHTL